MSLQGAYDELNPSDDDHRFYASLIADLGARKVVDLGCGTGTLARLIAATGPNVVAVDPDPEMIRIARAKTGPGDVEWRVGESDCIETAAADVAVMSGHVAQVFADRDSWCRTLEDVHRGLVPGGALTFETRNPTAQRWEGWTRRSTLRVIETGDGPVEVWQRTVAVDQPLVTYDTFMRNRRTGAVSRHRDVLAFRDQPTVAATLEHAGFRVSSVYGDWDRSQPTAASPELIFVAHRVG